jgi:hypothetical protein
MRLGLLGPADGDLVALEAAARFLLEDVAVDRAVYLGVDGALDQVIQSWATRLVGGDPGDSALWARATERCLSGTPDEIDAYLEAEWARRQLRIFESLPDAATRAVEMLGGALAVMVYDKGDLNEEDMLPARLLLFGKSKSAVVRQVGPRWFLAPGSIRQSGIMTLEDRDDGLHLTLFDGSGTELRTERLSTPRSAKVRVSGAGA